MSKYDDTDSFDREEFTYSATSAYQPMKLAEALNLRADIRKFISQLSERLNLNARVQEGDNPSEKPATLLGELESASEALETLIRRINRTNCETVDGDGISIMDMIARRDALALKNSILRGFLSSASSKTDRYSLKEIKFVSTMDVAVIRKRTDWNAKKLRELDTSIQMLNWTTELL